MGVISWTGWVPSESGLSIVGEVGSRVFLFFFNRISD